MAPKHTVCSIRSAPTLNFNIIQLGQNDVHVQERSPAMYFLCVLSKLGRDR